MRSPVAAAPALLCLLLTLVLAGGAFALLIATWSAETGPQLTPALAGVGFVIVALSFCFAGTVLAIKRPENLVGWLFLAYGVGGTFDILFGRYLLYTLVESADSSLPSLVAIGGLVNATWVLPMTTVVLVPICFPQGRPRTRWWSIAAWAVIAFAVIGMAVLAIKPGTLPEPFDARDNPIGLEFADDVQFIYYLTVLGSAVIVLASVVDLARRLRSSTGDEHEQLKWFAFVIAWLPPLMVIYLAVVVAGTTAGLAIDLLTALLLTVLFSLPIALGVAVLKYRLYDIDLIVNRTLVYVPLTAILAGIFSATTALTRTLFTEVSGQASEAAIAATTIAIVGLFTPVKNLLQSFVDRRFKEASDPAKPLLAMTTDARKVFKVLDAETFLQDFADRAAAALTAVNALVYLNGRQTPIVVSGDPLAAPVLSFPLIESGTHVGRLEIGASKQLRPLSPQQVSTLEKETDVLARGLVFYAAANGLQIERPDQTGPGVADSMIGAL